MGYRSLCRPSRPRVQDLLGGRGAAVAHARRRRAHAGGRGALPAAAAQGRLKRRRTVEIA